MHAGQGRPRPFDTVWAAALCAGVVVALWLPVLLPMAVVLPAALLGFGGWWRWPHSLLAATAAAFALGFLICSAHGHHALAQRLPPVLEGRVMVIEARILGLPETRTEGARFLVEVVRVLGSGDDVADSALLDRNLAVRWYGGGRSLRPGEIWRWPVRLRLTPLPAGPGQGDAGRRALLDAVIAEAVIQSGVRPLRLAPASGIDALRQGIVERITDELGAVQGRFVAALAVGDTRGLDDADWARLRQFGLTHLIAISGFHVGLVAGLGVLIVRAVWWLCPMLALRWPRPQAAALAATGVAVGYAALAGFSLPTVRTVLMIALVALLHASRWRTSAAQPLLLAVVLIALVDPFALLTPGFWLSCAGVAWLLWCLPRVSSVWNARAFLKAQWVVTLGLLPFVAAFFLQVPIAGPLANLVAIPWISLVVVPLSLLGTLLLPFSETVAGGVWALAAGSMEWFWRGLGAVPVTLAGSHWIPQARPLAVLLALLGFLLVLLPRGLPWRYAGLLLTLPLLFPRGVGPAKGEVEVVAFAMPRGDALLLRSVTSTVLVDAGPEASGLVSALRALGVENIDLRIETRSNAGRAGGIAAVDTVFPPDEIWHSSSGVTGLKRCESGRRQVFDGFELEALHPAPGDAGRNPDSACVLRMRSEAAELWLPSDAGRWVAWRLARANGFVAAPRQVWGAPAALAQWQVELGASAALATRAPGPTLARRWPANTPRVDRDGALLLRLAATHEEAPQPITPQAWRSGRARWWDGPPP